MNKINYYTHLLLHSPYRILVIFFINFLIYLSFHYNTISYCMNDNNLPEIAEPKVPLVRGIQPLTPLQMEISKFLNDAEILDTKNKLIAKQESLIQEIKQESILNKRGMEAYRLSHRGALFELAAQKAKYYNLVNQGSSTHVKFTNSDGTQAERYILLPEDYNRLKSQHFVFGLISLGVCGAIGWFGAQYLSQHLFDPTGIKAFEKELLRGIK